MPVYATLPRGVEARPIYLMVMTRVSDYTPLIPARDGASRSDLLGPARNATYLEIYRLLDGMVDRGFDSNW